MPSDVYIIGVGSTRFSPSTPELSFKELMFEAAVKAYNDAGIDARRDLDAIVSASEDYWEGISIFDEYIPDQLGGVLKPVFTVSGDGLWGVIHAYMLIKTGAFNIVAVEAHSKASDIVDINSIWRMAFDPYVIRPLIDNPHVLAGLEMNIFMENLDVDRDAISLVVSKNRANALNNPIAPYGSDVDPDMVSESRVVSYPLRELDISSYSDGAVVAVLAGETAARDLGIDAPKVKGVGWVSGSSYIEEWDYASPEFVWRAAQMAYSQAGIDDPYDSIDVAFIDDRYSFRELQSIYALGLNDGYSLNELMYNGVIYPDGDLPVNPFGGYLGCGYPLLAGGLLKLYNAMMYLRSAGPDTVESALVMARMEYPSPSAAVVILGW